MSLEKQQAFIKMHFIKKKNKGTEKTKKKQVTYTRERWTIYIGVLMYQVKQ